MFINANGGIYVYCIRVILIQRDNFYYVHTIFLRKTLKMAARISYLNTSLLYVAQQSWNKCKRNDPFILRIRKTISKTTEQNKTVNNFPISCLIFTVNYKSYSEKKQCLLVQSAKNPTLWNNSKAITRVQWPCLFDICILLRRCEVLIFWTIIKQLRI